MNGSFERRFGALASTLVEISRSRPWLVVALCALLTAGSVYVTATILEIDTDSDRLLSAELPVGQTNRALAEVFPDLQNNLIVMVEADEPADARAAADSGVSPAGISGFSSRSSTVISYIRPSS